MPTVHTMPQVPMVSTVLVVPMKLMARVVLMESIAPIMHVALDRVRCLSCTMPIVFVATIVLIVPMVPSAHDASSVYEAHRTPGAWVV